MAHVVHDESIQLLHCVFPNETLNVEHCKELREEVAKLVSVLYANSSFNAMELALEERVSRYNLSSWPDGFSCGPLALLKVLHIFGQIDDETPRLLK